MNPRPSPSDHRLSPGALLLALALLLAGCASQPVPPDWQTNSRAALQAFSAAYLHGNSRLAELELARARSEVSSTARADLLARVELVRCANRVASLEFDACAAYQPLAADAATGERAYARFLSGQWTGLEAALLPPHYQVLVRQVQSGPAPDNGARLSAIEDPLARLVAAGALLQGGQLNPQDIERATETASQQGWRRPLLAWLGLQQQRARADGDDAAVTRLQRRIDLVLQDAPKSP